MDFPYIASVSFLISVILILINKNSTLTAGILIASFGLGSLITWVSGGIFVN